MSNISRDRVEGLVAAIIDTREVVLNVGSDDGVEQGMRFVILDKERVPLTDPETGAELGEGIEVPKHVVKVVRVDPEFSVARTFRTIKGRSGSIAAIMGTTPDRVETIRVGAGETIRESLEPARAEVRIGDKVAQTIGDEYDD